MAACAQRGKRNKKCTRRDTLSIPLGKQMITAKGFCSFFLMCNTHRCSKTKYDTKHFRWYYRTTGYSKQAGKLLKKFGASSLREFNACNIIISEHPL